MKQNHSFSFSFISTNIISLLSSRKKASTPQKASFVRFLRKQGYHVPTLRGKQKYQITNVGVENIKSSRLLVQRINEFKMNEIQRKSLQ